MWSSRSLPVANTRRVMSDWPNRWMLRLPETIDRGVDTACGCNCHCLCLWFFSVARVWSGLVMIGRPSGLGMGVGRFSRPRRGVGLITMADAGLNTTRRVEVPPGAGALQLLLPGVAVGVFIDCHCEPDGVEVTHWLISPTRELFSEDDGVEFWPWIVEGAELPPSEESLLPTGTEMRLLAGGSWEFHEGPHFCWFWQLARLRTFRTTGVMSRWGCWKGIVQYRCSMLRM